MRHRITLLLAIIVTPFPVVALSETAGNPIVFSAQRGKVLWNQEFSTSNQTRSCATCHTSDPAKAGKHARTGKSIKPMAPSINPERLSDQVNVEKWFMRNCKWTMGRECSDQEKGDVLEFLKNI